jgi:hypothetical protein
MSKHLDFIEGDNSGKKTKYFEVQSKFDSCDLGRIKWHSHWRQYIFEPCLDTIWSFDCLEDLSLFLKNLNLEHKQEVKARKNANDDGIPSKTKVLGILPNRKQSHRVLRWVRSGRFGIWRGTYELYNKDSLQM